MKIFLTGYSEEFDKGVGSWRREFTRVFQRYTSLQIFNSILGNRESFDINKKLLEENRAKLKQSHLVIAKINEILDIETLIELGGAYVLGIPVYGFGDINTIKSSILLQHCVEVFFPDLESLMVVLKRELRNGRWKI